MINVIQIIFSKIKSQYKLIDQFSNFSRTRPFFASMILICMTQYLEMVVFPFAGVVCIDLQGKNMPSK